MVLKFVICEDNAEELNETAQTVTKVLMNYNIEYKVYKFKKYDGELKRLIRDPNDRKIYILDVDLPIKSGLEIASEIREQEDDSYIIFATMHPECRDDIFYSRLEAIDYVPKHDRYQERLAETIEYIVKRIFRNKSLDFTSNHVHYCVLEKEITYIEKEQNTSNCIIHFLNGDTKTVNTTIVSLSKKLSPLFVQSHKSCLVNIENISKIEYANYTIHFKNKESTTLLSISYRKELRHHVGDN